MACQRRERTGICGHPQCPYPTETTHGYGCVNINFATSLCEVGEGCLAKCSYSFTPSEVTTCPTCDGKFTDDVCTTCFAFGIVRKAVAA